MSSAGFKREVLRQLGIEAGDNGEVDGRTVKALDNALKSSARFLEARERGRGNGLRSEFAGMRR